MPSFRLAVLPTALLVVFAVACSSSSSDDDDDLGPVLDGGSSGDSGGACNTLTLDDVPDQTLTFSNDTPPTPTGGVVPDGTYVVESAVYYGTTGAGGTLGKTKIVFAGGTMQTASRLSPSAAIEAVTQTVVSSGATTLSFTETCPKAGATKSNGFSVEPGDDGGEVAVTLFTTEDGATATTRLVKR